MAGTGVIDDYVADLDARLRGDRRAKTDLLTEARDSLHDAAECYRDAGFDEGDAQRKAVDDFGPVSAIARGYQSELASAYSARTLRAVLFTLPAMNLVWETTRMLWLGSWENFPGPKPPGWYAPFTQINDTMSWAVAIAAALGLLFGRLAARRAKDSWLTAHCTAGVAVVSVGVAVLATTGLAIATAVYDPPRMYSSPPLLFASLAAFLVLGKLVVMARRTVRLCH